MYPQPDTNDSDGDPSTDRYVLVGWADLNQNWPGTQPQRLYSADFTLNSAATSATHVNFDTSSTAAGWTFASTPVTITPNAGPTIGCVVVSTANKVITWNAADSDGVAGSSLKIDGVNVSQIRGPYAAAIGMNFSAAIGGLAAGADTYVITARDKAGNSSSTTGTFSVSGAAKFSPSATFLASDAVLGASAETAVSAKAAWLYDDSNLLSA